MKNSLTKLFVTVLSIVLLIGAVAGISVLANEADAYDIKSINIVHGDTTTVLIAVDLPSDTELTEAPDVEVAYTFGGYDLKAEFHSYQYIAKYGAYYPVYYTVGIPAKDMGEAVVAEAHKAGTTPAAPSYAETSVADYLYTRLYRDGIVSATAGDDADRRGMYLALLEYGSYAQKVLWNNLEENADNQRTLVTDLIYVTAKGATVNGKTSVLLEKSEALTVAAKAVPAQYKSNGGLKVTTYDANGNLIETADLAAGSYTPTATAVITADMVKVNKDFEDESLAGMAADIATGTATVAIATENDNSFYRVVKAADGSSQEYITYSKNTETYDYYDCKVFEATLRLDYDYENSAASFNILFGRWNGLNKFTIMSDEGSNVLQLSDWRSGTGGDTTLRKYDLGVKVGEWFVFRAETYKNAEGNVVSEVFINGTSVGISTNLGEIDLEGDKFDNVTIVANKYMLDCTYDIDDIYLGQGVRLANIDNIPEEEPEEPDVPSEPEDTDTPYVTDLPVYDFESGEALSGMYIDGSGVATIATEDGNKYWSKAGGTEDYIYIPKTASTAADNNCTIIETKLRINHDSSKGTCSMNILYGRWNGMNKFALQIDKDTDAVQLSDWRSGANTSLRIYDLGVKRGEWFTLRIENYENENGELIARVYVDGKLVGESTNTGVLGSESANHNLNSLVYKANNNIIGTLDIDNIYFGEGKMLVSE